VASSTLGSKSPNRENIVSLKCSEKPTSSGGGTVDEDGYARFPAEQMQSIPPIKITRANKNQLGHSFLQNQMSALSNEHIKN